MVNRQEFIANEIERTEPGARVNVLLSSGASYSGTVIESMYGSSALSLKSAHLAIQPEGRLGKGDWAYEYVQIHRDSIVAIVRVPA